jgi:hypothetical protein
MKLVHPKKILYLSKMACTDCIPLILSFAFNDIETLQRTLLREIHYIFKRGLSRTNVEPTFYRMWNNPDNDCIWMHQYMDGKCIYLSNFNCVKCGNYEISYEPTIRHNSIICSCDTFCELYEDLTM